MESLYQRNRILLQIGKITTFPLETCYSNNFWIGKLEKEQLFATSEMRSEPQIWGRTTSKMRGKVIRFDKKVIKSEQICSNMIKKEPPPSEDGSSSRLLLHHPALIAGASARLWMPDSVLHTLPRTDEGRFSSHYRLSPQTHPDVPLKHPDSPIPHLHQWGSSGRSPCHFSKKGGLRTIHPTCMQLALPSRLSQQYKKLESKRVRPYIQCVCSWHPPEETHDRRQSDSAEAYMAFPKMLHSCLACLQ